MEEAILLNHVIALGSFSWAGSTKDEDNLWFVFFQHRLLTKFLWIITLHETFKAKSMYFWSYLNLNRIHQIPFFFIILTLFHSPSFPSSTSFRFGKVLFPSCSHCSIYHIFILSVMVFSTVQELSSFFRHPPICFPFISAECLKLRLI